MESSPLGTVSTAGWPPKPDQIPGNNAGKPERPEAPVGIRRVSPSSAEPRHLILLCHSPVASPETLTLNEKLQRPPGRRPPATPKSDQSTIHPYTAAQRCRQTQLHVKGLPTHYTRIASN